MRLPATMDAWIVDDDSALLKLIDDSLVERNWTTFTFSSARSLKEQLEKSVPGCVLIGRSIDGESGLELIKHVHSTAWPAPAILMSGDLTPSLALQALRAGAVGVLEKPFQLRDLHTEIEYARHYGLSLAERLFHRETAQASINALTAKHREVLRLLVDCVPTKQIAGRLNISRRTVENRKREIYAMLGMPNHVQLLQLTRLAQCPL